MKINKGFTLVELMVTIAIMVILTGVIMAVIGPSRSRGRDAKKVSDTQNLVLALETYFSKYRYYPVALNDANLTNYLSKDPTTLGVTYVPMYKTINSSITTCGGTGQVMPNFYHAGILLENNVSVDRAAKTTNTAYPTSGTPKYVRCGATDNILGASDAKMYDQVPSF